MAVINVVFKIVPYFIIADVVRMFLGGDKELREYMVKALIIAGSFMLAELCHSVSTACSHKATFTVLANIRKSCCDKLARVPLGYVKDTPSGSFKNIMVERIDSIETTLAHVVPEFTSNLLAPIIVIVYFFMIDWRLALFSFIPIIVGFATYMGMMIDFQENYNRTVEKTKALNDAAVEYIDGIEVIKAFGRAGTSYEKYAKAILDYKKFVVKWLSSTWITMKMTFALFPSTLLGTLPVGLYLTMHGQMTISQLVLAVILSMSMVTSFAKIEVFSENLREMQYNIESIQDFLTMKELPEPSARANITGYDVKLENVHFSYTGEEKDEVLHGIDLTMPAGSFTALVGPSGGGKSTVARLISRFWDVTSGSITIGGVNIKEMPLSQLSEMVSFVTQDNFLFRCSIMENIRLGNPAASDEQVREAARKACCEEFIEKLPQGYDTPAGEAGKRLSGGEKQRIAIARMMLKNAPIVILDEATAFTDPENENKIQKSIEELTKGKTLLVVAHRLSTITDADQIVVLKNGDVEAKGTQEELLQSCPLYQRMWQAHVGARHWAVGSQKEGEDSCLAL